MPDRQAGLFPNLAAAPISAGQAPRLWVRRLVLWRALGDDPVRDIPLRRGLNIVWSPAGGSDDQISLGHAAGKSLFCRMLRHCLGESELSNEEDSRSLRRRCPEGAVGAEVVVDGRVWAVRRDFDGRRDLAAPDVTLEELGDAPGGFDAYMDALAMCLGDEERRRSYPKPEQAWLYVLAWLTRDQESRLDGVLSWRHKDSSSGSPVRNASAGDRLTTLRVALRLDDPSARQRAEQITALSAEKEHLDERVKGLERHREAVSWELRELCPQAAPQLLAMQDPQRRLQIIEEELREPEVVSLTNARQRQEEQELEAEAGDLAAIDEEYRQLMARSDRLAEESRLYRGQRGRVEIALAEAEHPTCPYDNRPLDVEESLFRCPLVRFPDPEEVRRSLEEERRRVDDVEDELKRVGSELRELACSRMRLQERVGRLRRQVSMLREDQEREQAGRSEITRARYTARHLSVRWAEIDRDTELVRVELEQRAADLQELRAVENRSRDLDLSRLQRHLRHLVRRVLHLDGAGAIRLDRNGLQVDIGQRSVALNSLRVVLFDLAAMLCAAERQADFPAFLVHDSPREGDLDPFTYRSIFRAIDELGPDPNAAPFQYIITTTSEPPPLENDRTRLKLASSPPEERLLRIDL